MKRVKALLLALGIVFIIGGGLLSIASLIISKTSSLPETFLPILTTVICAVAVLTGGFVASTLLKEKGFLAGLCVGAIALLCFVGVSVLIFQNPFTAGGIGKGIAIFISGILGGILGVNRKHKIKF